MTEAEYKAKLERGEIAWAWAAAGLLIQDLTAKYGPSYVSAELICGYAILALEG